MKVLLLLPGGTKHTSGNWVTVKRLAGGLSQLGLKTTIKEVTSVSAEELANYDLVHCFHVFKTVMKIAPLLRQAKTPWVVTFTGTDLEQALEADNEAELQQVLAEAQRVFVFHPEAMNALLDHRIIAAAQKVQVIPQTPSSLIISPENDLRKELNLAVNQIAFLFAGGIRPVKGPLDAVDFLEPLAANNSAVRLVMAGPVLDEDIFAQLTDRITRLPWVRYLGEIAHEKMGNLYLANDVVINTSRWEGMPNTLLEAMSLGRAVLAKDIPGNRAIVTHGVDGLLYSSQDEFLNYAAELAKNKQSRLSLAKAAEEKMKNVKSLDEAEAYLKGYIGSC